MAHDPFRPFETNLDQDSALAMVRDATAGADDGELFLERRRSDVFVIPNGIECLASEQVIIVICVSICEPIPLGNLQ